MRLMDFAALSFDCYGTLIDWEAGIVAAFKPVLERNHGQAPDTQVLSLFAKHESGLQARYPDVAYPAILARTHRAMAKELKLSSDDELDQAFGASVRDWPAFADSADALSYLSDFYKLIILSNVDRRSFASSNIRLKVVFDRIFTAEDIGAYKPSDENFEYLLLQLGVDGVAPSEILHTAQSLYHDHIPAARHGLARCWNDRRDGASAGATRAVTDDVDVAVDFRFPSMAALVAAHKDTVRLEAMR